MRREIESKLDSNEIKLRIERQREQFKGAPKPRAAEAVEEMRHAPRPAKGALILKIYSIPALGYAARIATSIFNLPRIVGNLQVHYSAYHGEIRRLSLQIVELAHNAQTAEATAAQLAIKLAQLQRQLDEIASASKKTDSGP